jgi:hypothetical protein
LYYYLFLSSCAAKILVGQPILAAAGFQPALSAAAMFSPAPHYRPFVSHDKVAILHGPSGKTAAFRL